MFELIVLFFILSVYIALAFAIVLFGLRIKAAISYDGPLYAKLAVVFLPAGIGLYALVRKPSVLKRLHISFTFAMTLFAAIGAVWVAFLNIPEFAAWFFYG